jgi:hypothetical protein
VVCRAKLGAESGDVGAQMKIRPNYARRLPKFPGEERLLYTAESPRAGLRLQRQTRSFCSFFGTGVGERVLSGQSQRASAGIRPF